MNQHHPSDAPPAPDPDDFSAWEEAQQDSPEEEEESPPEPTPPEPEDPDALPSIQESDVPQEGLEEAARSFAAKHDLPSFEVLYRATRQAVSDLAEKVGVHDNDLEDVVNIAFASAWSDKTGMRGHTYKEFKGFALGLAKNRAVDWHRSQDLWKTNTELADKPEEHRVGEDDCDPWEPSVETIAAAREAYGRLLPRQQTVVRALLEGWTFKEIAGQMGVSKTRVRQIYEAAVKRLRPEG